MYFYQTYGVQQYTIKASLGLGFMIQFKSKTPNNILLIPFLAFTHFVMNERATFRWIGKEMQMSKFLRRNTPTCCASIAKF